MKTSLRDIALELNLSKTTVSWVLSGQGDAKGISLLTQEKVFRCAERMNYQPNLLARSLNTGVTGTVGLIVPSIADSVYSHIAKAVEMEAEKHGYSLMICSSESEIEREDRMIRLFKAKQVDGIILAPTKISKKEIEILQKESYPLVLFDRYFPEMGTNYVIIDNEESSYKLIKHLINKGSKKIAIITTNPHLRTMNMRREGYARAFMEAGLTLNTDLYGEVAYVNYENNVLEVLDRILAKVPDVDGFFFTTHILAIEAFRYFHDKNININDGYGLACMHDISSFSILAPNMSIARMPIEEIGTNTVRILLESIEYKRINKMVDFPKSLVLPCHLDLKF